MKSVLKYATEYGIIITKEQAMSIMIEAYISGLIIFAFFHAASPFRKNLSGNQKRYLDFVGEIKRHIIPKIIYEILVKRDVRLKLYVDKIVIVCYC